jgi:hypothetical protein
MMRQILKIISLLVAGPGLAMASAAQQISAPAPQPATIIGTVLDVNGGVVPGAKVVLNAVGADDPETVVASDNGFFQFANVKAGMPWQTTISAPGFANWNSNTITLTPGQYFILTGIHLRLATVQVSVVALTPEQVATRQVKTEETQHVFGIVPNFYVVYNHNPAPLTPKLKFKLAFKTLNDPVSLIGYLANAGIYQAADYPGYQGGMAGYGQRLGATLAGAYTHVLVADAVLPSLLHQDERYVYQGTGTTRSRILHALSNAIFTLGDNGRREINYSGIGGDLASGAIANAYYPSGQRGIHLVLTGALIGTGGRISYALANEFLLNRHTSRRDAP